MKVLIVIALLFVATTASADYTVCEPNGGPCITVTTSTVVSPTITPPPTPPSTPVTPSK